MNNQRTAPLSYTAASNPADPRLAALITLVAVAAIIAVYYQTMNSMVSIWNRSETFAHCFLIAPISAWMVWRQRARLMQIDHKPNPWVLILLLALGFGWLLATLAHVLVFQQYFVVAMIPVAIWAVLGNRMAGALAFPLAYLMLAVPFGEVFVPVLIDLTADFTVTALRLTGIPVYREGAFFSLPSGSWSVVEACSGLRYLIASFTLGTLYAYLTYTSLKRRLAFIVLALLVPIVANWIRAYIIVMIGHLSDMSLATGADHLVYGWVFFGAVMLLLFWGGSFWREDTPDQHDGEVDRRRFGSHNVSWKATAGVAAAAVAGILIWPWYLNYLDRDFGVSRDENIEIPEVSGNWSAVAASPPTWRPEYTGAPVRSHRTYRNGDHEVSIHVALYRRQQPGSQLITSMNALIARDDEQWRGVGEQTRTIVVGGERLTVTENRLHSPSQKLLLWRWYRLGAEETTSPYLAKIVLAKHKLLHQGDDGAEIIVAAEYEEKPDEAAQVLQSFLNDMLPGIRKGLVRAAAY